jgi:cytochrome P450
MSTADRPTVDFDHHSSTFAEDGIAVEDRLRSDCPVAWSKSHGGFWVVSDFEDVSQCLRETEAFSANKLFDREGRPRGGVMIPSSGRFRAIPNDTDPPEWNEYRRILNPPFSALAVEELSPKVLAFATHMIDDVIESGNVDFIQEIAHPVTALVTLDILGLPLRDWHFYATPIHRMAYDPNSLVVADGLAAIHQEVASAIVERRAHPKCGLIDSLISAEVNGSPLSDTTILQMTIQLLLGGIETTATLLGGALLYLDEHRSEHRRLVDDDRFLRTATEEFVRWVSPLLGLARTASQRTVVGGQSIEAGERVLFLFRSANRDARQFENPEVVQLERSPNRHAGFGIGIHRCLGANLARLVFKVLLRELLKRMPDYRIDTDHARPLPLTPVARGWIAIPATFTPGPRLGSDLEEASS